MCVGSGTTATKYMSLVAFVLFLAGVRNLSKRTPQTHILLNGLHHPAQMTMNFYGVGGPPSFTGFLSYYVCR